MRLGVAVALLLLQVAASEKAEEEECSSSCATSCSRADDGSWSCGLTFAELAMILVAVGVLLFLFGIGVFLLHRHRSLKAMAARGQQCRRRSSPVSITINLPPSDTLTQSRSQTPLHSATTLPLLSSAEHLPVTPSSPARNRRPGGPNKAQRKEPKLRRGRDDSTQSASQSTHDVLEDTTSGLSGSGTSGPASTQSDT